MAEFAKEQQRRGTWFRGPHAGRNGTTVAYRAGHLLTIDDNGDDSKRSGEPRDFETLDGQNGEGLLDELIPFPNVDSFYYGAVREAISSAHFHAISGHWYGDVNFADGGQYCCVDNQQGEDALVQFCVNRCFGVLSSGDPTRGYDPAIGIRNAPKSFQSALEKLVEKHGQWFCTPPTGLFWSEGNRLTGHEPFRVLYCYGFETMENLRLNDERWTAEFVIGCQSTPVIAKSITAVAKLYCDTRCPVEINSEVLETIFPANAPAREEAIKAVSTSVFADFISIRR